MALDRYGLVVSTASAAARDAYVEAVDCLLSANAGAEAGFDRAIAADPGFALAHIGRARSLQLQARVVEARDEGRLASGSALPMVAEGLGAFARGDYDEAIRLLEPAVDRFVRIGGSRAQRDLFENTLLAAYWRSGRGAAAAGLLERRLDRCPTVPRPRGA
jgi:tetratricopeptide (TPR) repeat protein